MKNSIYNFNERVEKFVLFHAWWIASLCLDEARCGIIGNRKCIHNKGCVFGQEWRSDRLIHYKHPFFFILMNSQVRLIQLSHFYHDKVKDRGLIIKWIGSRHCKVYQYIYHCIIFYLWLYCFWWNQFLILVVKSINLLQVVEW